MTELNDRPPAALITGGAVRLGKAIALALARHGYHIALHYNNSHKPAEQTRTQIEELGVRCQLFQQDLTAVNELPALVDRAHVAFPGLNVLVNNASGYAQATIRETTPEIFLEQMAVNLQAPFFLTQAFARVCGQGSVINILDNKIGFNQFHYAAYVLSKKSLVKFTKMAAVELAPAVRVNGIAPGVVLPAETRSRQYISWRVRGIPLKRQGDPAHVTQTISYLLENSFVTGQIFIVDGGESLTNVGRNAATYPPDNELGGQH